MNGADLEATDYVLEYTFKGEAPLNVKGYKLSVVRIHSIDLEEGALGNKNTLVVGVPKTFQVTVSNHEMLENDRVKYVVGTDCSAAPFLREFPVNANHTFTVFFEESTTEELHLCYRLQYDETYDAEEYFMLPGLVLAAHARRLLSDRAVRRERLRGEGHAEGVACGRAGRDAGRPGGFQDQRRVRDGSVRAERASPSPSSTSLWRARRCSLCAISSLARR